MITNSSFSLIAKFPRASYIPYTSRVPFYYFFFAVCMHAFSHTYAPIHNYQHFTLPYENIYSNAKSTVSSNGSLYFYFTLAMNNLIGILISYPRAFLNILCILMIALHSTVPAFSFLYLNGQIILSIALLQKKILVIILD